ncbi:hypothetical protein L6452_34894 [Arctium lappa]|uniref:Uncharacterized protein n=1 Tax=Arctium lappa TaxID=4217 RepID=A0ACB8YJI8_ARCLA|nr:hypothetical protein L6452_34894 [Arctium lappa]
MSISDRFSTNLLFVSRRRELGLLHWWSATTKKGYGGGTLNFDKEQLGFASAADLSALLGFCLGALRNLLLLLTTHHEFMENKSADMAPSEGLVPLDAMMHEARVSNEAAMHATSSRSNSTVAEDAAHKNFTVYQMDVKTAFLNDILKEEFEPRAISREEERPKGINELSGQGQGVNVEVESYLGSKKVDRIEKMEVGTPVHIKAPTLTSVVKTFRTLQNPLRGVFVDPLIDPNRFAALSSESGEGDSSETSVEGREIQPEHDGGLQGVVEGIKQQQSVTHD